MKYRRTLLIVLVLPVFALAGAVTDGTATDATAADKSGVNGTAAYAAGVDGSLVYTGGVPGDFAPPAPALQYAHSAAVLDYETGTLLYGLRHEDVWAPASLTKLVTIYTALDAVGTGEFSLHDPQPVHPDAWASAMPAGSSLMFLGPDQLVTGADLFRGLLVSSGNDAATEVALRVSSSVSTFAGAMNAAMTDLGYPHFYFEEPAGLSPANRITAGDFAKFVGTLISRYPRILTEYASLPAFTYPESRHYSDGQLQGGSIRQENRNLLIGEYDGADGLKTGFIEESGYNIVATAERNGRRLIVVVLGVAGTNHGEGGRRRAEDATTLLDWGFEHYRRVAFPRRRLDEIAIWGGRARSVAPITLPMDEIALPASAVSLITRNPDIPAEIWAPVGKGEVVGSISYVAEGITIARQEVAFDRPVEKGSLFRRLLDRIKWWFRGVSRALQRG